MPRRKIIIRKTPFEFVERFDDDGNEESWGITREENDEILAWESADLRKTRFNGRKPKPEELAKADEIDAWRGLKAGDDATSAIETTMQRFQLTSKSGRINLGGSPSHQRSVKYLREHWGFDVPGAK